MRLLIVTQVVDSEHSNLGFFHGWIEEFSRQCESVHVVCLQEGQHRLPDNVEVYSLGKEAGKPRIVYLLRFFAYITGLRKEYDAVFVHMNSEYVLLGALLWRLWGKKIALWYAHGGVPTRFRIAVRLADIIFSSSNEGVRISSPKIRIVGQGIDMSRFPQRVLDTHQELRIVTVGRISGSKRILEMLPVLDRLSAENTPFTFMVVGEPLTEADMGYEEQLRTAVASKPYADSVTFAGAVAYARIPSVLASADVMLHLSKTGSVDKAVLDALAAGTRVVSTSEAFKTPMPGVTSVADNPEAIALALCQKGDAPEVMQSYISEHYGLAKLVQKILALL